MNTKDDFFNYSSQLINKTKQLEVVQKTIHLLNTKDYFANIKTQKDSTKFKKIRKKLLKDLKNSGCCLNHYKFNVSRGFYFTPLRVEISKTIQVKKEDIVIKLVIYDPEMNRIVEKEKVEVELEERINIQQKIKVGNIKIQKKSNILSSKSTVYIQEIQQKITKKDYKEGLIRIFENEDCEVSFSNSKSMCHQSCLYFQKILKELNNLDTNIFLNYIFFNKSINTEHFELLYDVNINELDFLSLFKTDLNSIMTPFLSIDKNKGLKNE